MYTHTHAYIHTYIHTYVFISTRLFLYLSIYLSIYLPTWVICYRSWTLHNCGNCFVFVRLLLSDAGASHPQEGSCEGKKDVIWGEKGKLNLQEKLEPTRMDWLESVPVLPTSNRDEIGNMQRRWLLSPWGKGSPGPRASWCPASKRGESRQACEPKQLPPQASECKNHHGCGFTSTFQCLQENLSCGSF